MYRIARHKNGLTVATATMPHMASVSLGIWVGVGGRHEPARLNGVSHFIEHMLFKGTRKRSALEISQAVEGIGGYLNAFTGEEHTCFFSKARFDRFDELLDVLADMFLHSEFDPQEIDKERNVIKEELAMYQDQPHHHVQELLNEILWPNQPLGRSLTGTERTLDAMTRDKLMHFQRSHYVTRSTLVTLAGNIRHSKAMRALKPFVPSFPKGGPCGFSPAKNGQLKPRIRLFSKEVEQSQLAIGFRVCSRHDKRRYALRLLNTILGENMSSRLFQVVREDHGLAYSIYSSLSFLDDVGSLTISAGLDTAHLSKTLALILKELKRLKESPVPEEELQRARDYLTGQIDLSLENTENQMMWVGEQVLGYGHIVHPSEVKRQIAQVKAAEVQEVAREFFRHEHLNLALVTPLKSERGISRVVKL